MSKEERKVLTGEEKKVISKYFETRMEMWNEYILYMDPRCRLPVEVNELIKAGFLNGYAVGIGIIMEDKE